MKPMAVDALSNIEGLTSMRGSFGPKETIDRLEAEIRRQGLTIFARIDHAAGAAEVGLTLRPTELIIFGNARGGTPLMQSAQTVAIDLPLKAVVWEDVAGKTWISYNEPKWIARRHGIANAEPVVAKMADLLHAISTAAASPNS
jgi:uncharacterized protein (DUF302 family)